MIEPIAKAFSKDAFEAYVDDVVSKLMGAWRPRGFVLHNTGIIPPRPNPSVQNFYTISGKKPLAGPQRIRNMWETYRNQKPPWKGGPHLVVTDREIFAGNPLWLAGTHSPSWNATFWGLEMVGDYDIEPFPDALRDNAVHAMACCYAMLGREPDDQTFHFHKEDPGTTHKHCPGTHVGDKASWIAMIRKRMAELYPGGGHEPLTS